MAGCGKIVDFFSKNSLVVPHEVIDFIAKRTSFGEWECIDPDSLTGYKWHFYPMPFRVTPIMSDPDFNYICLLWLRNDLPNVCYYRCDVGLSYISDNVASWTLNPTDHASLNKPDSWIEMSIEWRLNNCKNIIDVFTAPMWIDSNFNFILEHTWIAKRIEDHFGYTGGDKISTAIQKLKKCDDPISRTLSGKINDVASYVDREAWFGVAVDLSNSTTGIDLDDSIRLTENAIWCAAGELKKLKILNRIIRSYFRLTGNVYCLNVCSEYLGLSQK